MILTPRPLLNIPCVSETVVNKSVDFFFQFLVRFRFQECCFVFIILTIPSVKNSNLTVNDDYPKVEYSKVGIIMNTEIIHRLKSGLKLMPIMQVRTTFRLNQKRAFRPNRFRNRKRSCFQPLYVVSNFIWRNQFYKSMFYSTCVQANSSIPILCAER
jgi:hypothetical protein